MIKLSCLVLLAACGSDPVAAPTDGSATTTPSISGVFPTSAFIGRDVRVEVSGDATHWTDSTTVSFGAGVTVHSVSVGSPTSLFADITVADSATAGLADVSIGSLVLKGGLDIEPPLRFTTKGSLAQGSIVDVTIENLDFEHPFDTRQVPFQGEFPHIKFDVPPGTAVFDIPNATAFQVEVILTIDVDAQPGELVINNGPRGDTLRMSAGAFAVTPRTAIALAPNATYTGGAVDTFETRLFSFTADAAPSVTLASVDSGGFYLLPASGHWEDTFTFSTIPNFDELDPAVLLSDKYYMIYGAADVPSDSFHATFLEYSLGQVNETAQGNNTAATAQPIQLPAMFADANLTSAQDVDLVKFQVAAADIGKTVRVMTEGDVATQIDVFADAALTINLGESAGQPFDDFTSQAIPDGTTTIYVEFSPTADFDPGSTDYLAAVFLE